MNVSAIHKLSKNKLVDLSMKRKVTRESGGKAVYTEDAIYAQRILYDRSGKWEYVVRRTYACDADDFCDMAHFEYEKLHQDDMCSWNDEYVDSRL